MRPVLILIILQLWAFQASAQTEQSWIFRYIEADGAGKISACSAEIEFSNAFFTARIYQDEFDFLYYRDDFTLPFGESLGSVIFRIDGRAFVLFAESVSGSPAGSFSSARAMFINPLPDDRGPLFRALSGGNIFDLEFPDGSKYRFPLRGSAEAFSAASSCWSSRPTGAFSNNPFDEPVANNPFE